MKEWTSGHGRSFFSRGAAALLLLGGAWAVYSMGAAWGSDPGGPDPGHRGTIDISDGLGTSGGTDDEGERLAPSVTGALGQGVTVTVGEIQSSQERSSAWYLAGSGSESCEGALPLPSHELWEPGSYFDYCVLGSEGEEEAAPDEGPAVLVLPVPRGAVLGEVRTDAGEELALTLLLNSAEWPVGFGGTATTRGRSAVSSAEYRW